MTSLAGEMSTVPQDAILEHLGKVLSSQSFQGAERAAKLLRFMVEQTVSGQPDRLKEYTLGTEALGKGTSFDPRTDTIVRAEVARLRSRLDRYYATEGLDDTVGIALPKGSYVPQFQERTRPAPATSPERPKTGRPTRTIWFALALGFAACAFAAAVVWDLWRAPAPDSAVSIAVLPFANLSTEANQEFFSDGITDEISGALAKIPDLRVVGRSSAFQFKGANKDLRAVGQALGATHLIEGSVRQAGNRVRIAAQLIETTNGLQLWSASYDRELTDVFAIQEDIATAIAAALQMPLGVRQGERLVSNRTVHAESYQRFLQAKALVRVRGPKALTDAASLLEQVVSRDPDFAPAWALLGLTDAMTPLFSPAMYNGDADELRHVVGMLLPRAEAAANRSIQLDANLADGYSSLALAQHLRGKFLQADELYSKALALDPNNSEALFYYSELLANVGRVKDSLRVKLQLRALEPFVPIFNVTLAVVLWVNDQNDAAIALLKSAPADYAVPPAGFLAAVYASMGRYGEAADSMLQVPSGIFPPGMVDQIQEAARILRSAPATAAGPQTLPSGTPLNFVYLYAGYPERALSVAEFSAETGYFSPGGYTPLWQSSGAPARKTERFKTYLRKSGHVDYWRARGWPDLCRPIAGDDFECN
jgi:adenylate cyclase